jgi:hypothetical protein
LPERAWPLREAENGKEDEMDLKLTDIEANAIQHALRQYLKSLEESGGDAKGKGFEEDAVKKVLAKMQQLSGASGT